VLCRGCGGCGNVLFDPAIAAHNGRVVKRAGEGILVQFRGVVEAVRCAIKLQNGMSGARSSCVLAFVWLTSFRRFGESSAAMTVTVAVKT
jgi:hypothetical protein